MPTVIGVQMKKPEMIHEMCKPRPAWRFNCNDCGAYGRAYWPYGEVADACPVCESKSCGLEKVISPEEVADGLAFILLDEFASECAEIGNGDYENELEFAKRLLAELKELRAINE